jgi:TusA-related sulfurtransferase
MLEDVEKKVETTKDGVVITITSKNPETVKKIQEHIAEMSKHEAEMMKRAAGDKEIKIEIKEEKKEII